MEMGIYFNTYERTWRRSGGGGWAYNTSWAYNTYSTVRTNQFIGQNCLVYGAKTLKKINFTNCHSICDNRLVKVN